MRSKRLTSTQRRYLNGQIGKNLKGELARRVYERMMQLARNRNVGLIEEKLIPDAALMHYRGRYYIIINPNQPIRLKVFSMGHELGHYVLKHLDKEEAVRLGPACLIRLEMNASRFAGKLARLLGRKLSREVSYRSRGRE